MRFVYKNKGFSVIELVIALAILAIIFSLLGPFFVTSVDLFGDSNRMVIDQANLRKVLTSVSREMRDATAVTIINESRVQIDDNTYYFDDENNTIIKSPSAGDEVVIADYVASFKVESDINDEDLITITTESLNTSQKIVTSVYLRTRPVPTADGGT